MKVIHHETHIDVASEPASPADAVPLALPVAWWDHPDFPYSAPWWFRYPLALAVFTGAVYAFGMEKRVAAWMLTLMLGLIGVVLVRELTLALILAAVAWGVLAAAGAAFAALPVSAAIIIGAMILAESNRRR